MDGLKRKMIDCIPYISIETRVKNNLSAENRSRAKTMI